MKPDVNIRAYVRVWTDRHLSHATQECDADILRNMPTRRLVVRWCCSHFVRSRLERNTQGTTDIDAMKGGDQEAGLTDRLR